MEKTRAAQRPEEVSIKHAANGGYIVRHSFNNMGSGESYRQPEEHAFGDHKSMMSHIHKHTSKGGGGNNDASKPAGVGTNPAPVKTKAPTVRTYGAGVD
jgi:hypothetical protein